MASSSVAVAGDALNAIPSIAPTGESATEAVLPFTVASTAWFASGSSSGVAIDCVNEATKLVASVTGPGAGVQAANS